LRGCVPDSRERHPPMVKEKRGKSILQRGGEGRGSEVLWTVLPTNDTGGGGGVF